MSRVASCYQEMHSLSLLWFTASGFFLPCLRPKLLHHRNCNKQKRKQKFIAKQMGDSTTALFSVPDNNADDKSDCNNYEDKNKVMLVDIGINLTNKSFKNNWKEVVQRAISMGVDKMLLTGTSVQKSKQCLEMAELWYNEFGTNNLLATVGIHPHDAKTLSRNNSSDYEKSIQQMKEMLQHPLAVAVGECGLDYNRNFSSREDQIFAFQEQVKLAYELRMPLFVHEREAHQDLIKVFDDVAKDSNNHVDNDNNIATPPPIIIHCFTGTEQEAFTYIKKGYYIGFTGTICKKERGAPLRHFLPNLPLNRIMVETDAPYMGFKKGRKKSLPEDVVDVAKKLSETIDVPFREVCEKTTKNAFQFFQIDE